MKTNSPFIIFVHHLVGGRVEEIEESLNPSFLEVEEPDLSFRDPILMKGTAELSEESIFLKLKLDTAVLLPCAICDQKIKVPLVISDIYHVEDISELKGDLFDFKEVVREEILLSLPQIVECGGNCPERAALAPFLTPAKKEFVEEKIYPFKDL